MRHVHSLGDDRPQALWFPSSWSPNGTAAESPNGTAPETSDVRPLSESRTPVPAKQRDTSVKAPRCSGRTIAQATDIRSICRFGTSPATFRRELETPDLGSLGESRTPLPTKCPDFWFPSSWSSNGTAPETPDLGSLGESRTPVPAGDSSDLATRRAEERSEIDNRLSRGRQTTGWSGGAHKSRPGPPPFRPGAVERGEG